MQPKKFPPLGESGELRPAGLANHEGGSEPLRFDVSATEPGDK